TAPRSQLFFLFLNNDNKRYTIKVFKSLFFCCLTCCLFPVCLPCPAVHRFIVEEGSDVTLLCSLGNDDSIEKMVFDWKKTDQEVFLYARGVHYNKGITGQDEQFRGRVSHFPEELKNGNASIVIRNTVLADSGNYTCIFPDFEPHRRFDVELVVPTMGASPHIVILNATEDGVPLLCEVGGAAPKPTLQWQDSDGNVCPAEEPQVSERGGRYFVSLLATVTRTTTNRFRCVASQEDVHHRTHTDIDVPGEFRGLHCQVLHSKTSPDPGHAATRLVLSERRSSISKCIKAASISEVSGSNSNRSENV
uniref:Ig-like domain-containing protein n=1 Tax=Stegastes partitus TaxID=144197 RepID=A0A3B5ATL7_9TELE